MYFLLTLGILGTVPVDLRAKSQLSFTHFEATSLPLAAVNCITNGSQS